MSNQGETFIYTPCLRVGIFENENEPDSIWFPRFNDNDDDDDDDNERTRNELKTVIKLSKNKKKKVTRKKIIRKIPLVVCIHDTHTQTQSESSSSSTMIGRRLEGQKCQKAEIFDI